jgi:Capsule polysaccharide biosynthesis protein
MALSEDSKAALRECTRASLLREDLQNSTSWIPMSKSRVLLILNEGRYVSLAEIMDRLEAEGEFESWVGVSLVRREVMEKVAKPKHHSRIRYFDEIPNSFPGHSEAADFLAEAAKRHPQVNFGKIFSAEKYPARRFAGGLRDVAHLFRCLESLCDQEHLDLIISDYPAVALDMMAYYLFKDRGGQALYFIQGRIGARLLLIDNLENPKREVQELYDKYRQEGLAQEDVKRAQEYINNFRRNKVKPAYFEMQSKPRNFFNHFRKMIYYPGGLNPANMLQSKLTRMRAKRSWRKFTFHKIDARDRVVFFPIQYTPEASVYIRSPILRDQAAAVSQLAMSLPAGYTLYVKDHPLLKWNRDEAYYRRLLEFPNVKLMEYGTDTHDILRHAKLTVTGSSTAGMESLFYRVPVLLLGGADTAYQNFQGVLKIEGLSLEEAVAKALSQQIQEEDIHPMVLSMMNAGMPGRFDDPRWDPTIIGKENLEFLFAFFKSSLARLRELKTRGG